MSVEISKSFRWLDQVQPSERLLVGDKAYHLSVLLQQGYPVIPGLVVTTPVMRRFLETFNSVEPMLSDLPNSSLHLNVDNPYQLQAIARRMRHAIQSTTLSSDWTAQLLAAVQPWGASALIVRPSLALNLRGDPGLSQRVRGLLASQACWVTEAELARALQAVWAELFHARSLFYWARSRIPLQHLHLGVLIQPLWSADIAGEMHVDETTVQIQSVQGLGHGLVRGDVLPDQYTLDLQSEMKTTVEIRPKTYAYYLHPVGSSGIEPSPLKLELMPSPSVQPTLNTDQLRQLQELGFRAKQTLGYALDMEWCHSTSPQGTPGFWLTQVNLRQGRTLVSQEEPTPLEESVLIALRKQTLQHWVGVGAATGRVLKPVLVMQGLPPQPDMMRDHILVVRAINPEWLPALQRAAGLITEQGGVTSHGAILARELGIPAVVGAVGIMEDLRSGDMVLLDGDRGTIARLAATASQFLSTSLPSGPVKSQSTTTQLMVSLSQSERLAAIAQLPLDGLGLLRSEHLMMRLLEGQTLEQALANPDAFVERLAQEIRPFLEAFALRPVFYRSADLRSHEYPSVHPPSSQQNSLLGWHGPLGYLQNPTLFQAELRALQQLQQEGYTNVRLLLPFVRTVEEFRTCFTWIKETRLCHNPAFQVWIMAEVPAVLFQLPEFVRAGVQGISIGTNDLTQLLLAIDRDQADLADTYTAAHPSVMRAMHYLVDTAKSLGIPCMVCGEAPAHYPEIIPELVQWGITGLSVSPDAVEWVGRAIAQAEQQLILDAT
ncbi:MULTISPECIES: putative PEP-binding protein [unclassified Leptolyngbya]|uniref:putative PEP-binding protein n=1 Tax=unclassified Leptolyngbya TaxID=2650499 RepID=UPI00168517B8|nr:MULTISPECIES: putative PEP-binding protein [unclassified Leptolyngbya]MBD1913343.1 hypothetical protein [Leptolyngbya sp. FACHB-8]MBD2154498.1 hypothetical protein [Leptolyngbya sp. FACHB-16]